MDRIFLDKHRVRIYQTQEHKDSDQPMGTVQAEQWPFAGFVYYKYMGEMYPGFSDVESANPADACIVLTKPLHPRTPRALSTAA